MLPIGAEAPPFSGSDQNGNPVELRDLLEKGPVILYFYPKDFTPVCTRQACHFRDAGESLADLAATVVGVSVDDADTHRKFAAEHGLRFSLLADPHRTLARDYEALGPFGLGTRRITYVIGRDGTIHGAFHHELRAKKHVEQVTALLSRA